MGKLVTLRDFFSDAVLWSIGLTREQPSLAVQSVSTAGEPFW